MIKNIDMPPEIIRDITLEAVKSGKQFKTHVESILTDYANVVKDNQSNTPLNIIIKLQDGNKDR